MRPKLNKKTGKPDARKGRRRGAEGVIVRLTDEPALRRELTRRILLHARAAVRADRLARGMDEAEAERDLPFADELAALDAEA